MVFAKLTGPQSKNNNKMKQTDKEDEDLVKRIGMVGMGNGEKKDGRISVTRMYYIEV